MISNANTDKAASDGLGKEGHVTPALQLVSGQSHSVQLFRQRHWLRLGRNFFLPDLGEVRMNKGKEKQLPKKPQTNQNQNRHSEQGAEVLLKLILKGTIHHIGVDCKYVKSAFMR